MRSGRFSPFRAVRRTRPDQLVHALIPSSLPSQSLPLFSSCSSPPPKRAEPLLRGALPALPVYQRILRCHTWLKTRRSVRGSAPQPLPSSPALDEGRDIQLASLSWLCPVLCPAFLPLAEPAQSHQDRRDIQMRGPSRRAPRHNLPGRRGLSKLEPLPPHKALPW